METDCTISAVQDYNIHGWVALPQILDSLSLEAARKACCDHAHEDPFWIMDIHAGDESEWLLKALCAPRLLLTLRAFCGYDVCLSSSQFFVKPGGCKRVVGWHQDGLDGVQGDFSTAPLHDGAGPLTLWIALDKIDEHNGGLRVIPQLHLHGQLPSAGMPSAEDASGVGVGIIPEIVMQHHAHAVQYRLEPGDGAAHHPFTPHSSGPNVTDHDRRVLLLRFLPRRMAAEYASLVGPIVSLDEWRADGRPRGRCVLLS